MMYDDVSSSQQPTEMQESDSESKEDMINVKEENQDSDINHEQNLYDQAASLGESVTKYYPNPDHEPKSKKYEVGFDEVPKSDKLTSGLKDSMVKNEVSHRNRY